MRWENEVHFDCLVSRQHFCQKLSQSNRVCKDDSKSKVERFSETQCRYWYNAIADSLPSVYCTDITEWMVTEILADNHVHTEMFNGTDVLGRTVSLNILNVDCGMPWRLKCFCRQNNLWSDAVHQQSTYCQSVLRSRLFPKPWGSLFTTSVDSTMQCRLLTDYWLASCSVYDMVYTVNTDSCRTGSSNSSGCRKWCFRLKTFTNIVAVCQTTGRKHNLYLECGPMPNVMVALPNTGSALCSTPQSLADAHYSMLCSNAAKTRNLLKFAGVPQTTG